MVDDWIVIFDVMYFQMRKLGPVVINIQYLNIAQHNIENIWFHWNSAIIIVTDSSESVIRISHI